MKTNKSILYFLLLLLVLGLACQTVTGGLEQGTAESITIAAPDVVETAAAAPTTDVVVAVETIVAGATGVAGATPVPSLADALEQFPNISQAHEENPIYFDRDVPPPGGVHAPVWQNCGVYTEPIETKNALHSLEHGAVWLTYNPDLPEEEVQLLQEVAKDQAYTLMSPFPDLRSAVVIVGWGIRFETDSVADPRILEFLLTYQQGPQTPEPGAPCQGGLGSPVSPGALGFNSG